MTRKPLRGNHKTVCYGVGLKYRGGLILKFEVYEDKKHGKNKGKKGENGVTCGRIVMVLRGEAERKVWCETVRERQKERSDPR
ncbi:unnamed protein product, partial [Vitis vinifera]